MATRMGRWDCTSCGTRGILGPEQACTQCGAARPDDVRFYLPQNEPAVTDPAQIAEAQAGPDWDCLHCGADNKATHKSCSQCGAERGSSPTLAVREYGLGEVPRSGDEEEKERSPTRPASVTQKRSSPGLNPDKTWMPASGKPNLLPVGALVIVLLLIAWLFWPRQEMLAVIEKTWERSIQIEGLQAVTEEAWTIPIGGRQISSWEEISHYERVFSHNETRQREVCEYQQVGWNQESYRDCANVQTGTTEYVCGARDLGNGYFDDIMCSQPVYENQCTTKYREVPVYNNICHWEQYQEPVYAQDPVYKTRYSYQVDRWLVVDTTTLTGTNTQPQWPVLNLEDKEREGSRSSRYIIFFSNDEDDIYKQEFDLEVWDRLQVGQEVPAEVYLGGNVKLISKE